MKKKVSEAPDPVREFDKAMLRWLDEHGVNPSTVMVEGVRIEPGVGTFLLKWNGCFKVSIEDAKALLSGTYGQGETS